jgi:predicted  nucleic acid-binding Zn-ribbon protein
LQRLQGVLHWQMATDYDNRLAAAHRHLRELDGLLEGLRAQHQRVVRFKREAYQSFEGYDIPFQRLQTRLQSLRTRVQGIMAQQARYLEKVAVKELDRRRQKLADYRVKARFALAESYDRATKKQAREAEEMLREQQQIEEQRIREIRVDEAPAAQPETDGDQTGTAQPEPADAEQAQ